MYLAKHHDDAGGVYVVLALAVTQRGPQHRAKRLEPLAHLHLELLQYRQG